MVMPMMDGPVMPAKGGNIDDILISKVLALPIELKQSLLEVIDKMGPSSEAPVSPGLEDNLMGPSGEGPII
jgi:hypothetical protein